jgi:hypothetical protein
MADHHTQKRPVARGVKDPRKPDLMQIVVRIDDETFAEIRAIAVAEQTSFSEQIRMLIEWGLEAQRNARRNG